MRRPWHWQRRSPHAAAGLVTELASVLTAFRAASQCDASVWTRGSDGTLTWEAATNRPPPPTTFPSITEGPATLQTPEGPAIIAAIPGPRRAWLVIGPSSAPDVRLDAQLRFLLPVVSQFMQSALEVEHAANELAERYEEI